MIMRAEDRGRGVAEWLINKYLQCDHDTIARHLSITRDKWTRRRQPPNINIWSFF